MNNDSSQKNLGKSISVGASWMVALRWTIKSLGLISSIILARLLMPEDFGLIALAMSVYALIRLIREFGFGAALIQNQNATRVHYNSAWTLQVILSSVAALLLVSVAPFASTIYDDDRLTPLLIILSFSFFVTGFYNIGTIDFRKNMTFDKVFTLNIIPKIFSFITTISLAFYLRNYWALLIGQLTNQLLSVVMSYTMQSYRPRFSLAAWRELMGFSSWLMLNNVITYMNRHGRNIVVAMIGGPPMVGLISVSTDFATIVSMELIAPINTAAYPGYSRVNNNSEKLRKVFLEVVSVISLLAIPGSIAIAALVPLFVPVLLGEKWLEAVTVIPAMAYASIFMAFSSAFDMALMAVARQRVTTALVTIRLIIFFPLMYCLLGIDGAKGVADALLVSNLLVFPIYLVAVRRYLGASISSFLSTTLRPTLASIIMFLAVAHYVGFLGSQVLGVKGIIGLASAVGLGAIVLILSSYLIWWLFGKPDGVESRIVNIVQNKVRSIAWW